MTERTENVAWKMYSADRKSVLADTLCTADDLYMLTTDQKSLQPHLPSPKGTIRLHPETEDDDEKS